METWLAGKTRVSFWSGKAIKTPRSHWSRQSRRTRNEELVEWRGIELGSLKEHTYNVRGQVGTILLLNFTCIYFLHEQTHIQLKRCKCYSFCFTGAIGSCQLTALNTSNDDDDDDDDGDDDDEDDDENCTDNLLFHCMIYNWLIGLLHYL